MDCEETNNKKSTVVQCSNVRRSVTPFGADTKGPRTLRIDRGRDGPG